MNLRNYLRSLESDANEITLKCKDQHLIYAMQIVT